MAAPSECSSRRWRNLQTVVSSGHGFVAQINPGKAAHERRIVQGFLDRRVGKVEPLLKEVNPQHALDPNWTASVARLRIVRLDQRAQLAPRNHLPHLVQKQSTLRLLRVPLEPRRHRQCLLPHVSECLSFTLHTGAPWKAENLIRVSFGWDGVFPLRIRSVVTMD